MHVLTYFFFFSLPTIWSCTLCQCWETRILGRYSENRFIVFLLSTNFHSPNWRQVWYCVNPEPKWLTTECICHIHLIPGDNSHNLVFSVILAMVCRVPSSNSLLCSGCRECMEVDDCVNMTWHQVFLWLGCSMFSYGWGQPSTLLLCHYMLDSTDIFHLWSCTYYCSDQVDLLHFVFWRHKLSLLQPHGGEASSMWKVFL